MTDSASRIKTATVVGGGLGGLFTGALLARNGLHVTVLEKNATIGGGLQCFRRGDKVFETGMHVMGGMRPGGSIDRICRYLGICEQLDIVDVDDECMDTVTYASDGACYRLPSGREAFTEALAGYFPAERDGIRRYVDELYALADEVDLFNLRPSAPTMTVHSSRFTMAADRLIAEYLRDPKLRDLAAYINPLYGGVAGHTPAYIHALISVLYIGGASRLAGGSSQMADALADVIRRHGGLVLTSAAVTRIECQERHIQYVECHDGRRFSADRYISAVHPCHLLDLLPGDAFVKSYRERLTAIADSISAFCLFIDLKPGRVPYINHTCYWQEDYGMIWDHHDYGRAGWPRGFMYMTPPDPQQGPWASRMLVNCLMTFDSVERWSGTRTGRRGDEYLAWKQNITGRILSRLEAALPGIRDSIAAVYSASPLTIRDYYNTRRGAIFGYAKDCENLMLSQIPVVTKIDNLLLTGQNINLHGICGVPLTAINTAEAILGLNAIVNEL